MDTATTATETRTILDYTTYDADDASGWMVVFVLSTGELTDSPKRFETQQEADDFGYDAKADEKVYDPSQHGPLRDGDEYAAEFGL